MSPARVRTFRAAFLGRSPFCCRWRSAHARRVRPRAEQAGRKSSSTASTIPTGQPGITARPDKTFATDCERRRTGRRPCAPLPSAAGRQHSEVGDGAFHARDFRRWPWQFPHGQVRRETREPPSDRQALPADGPHLCHEHRSPCAKIAPPTSLSTSGLRQFDETLPRARQTAGYHRRTSQAEKPDHRSGARNPEQEQISWPTAFCPSPLPCPLLQWQSVSPSPVEANRSPEEALALLCRGTAQIISEAELLEKLRLRPAVARQTRR